MNAVTTVLELAIGDRLKRAKLAVEDTKRYADLSVECAILARTLLKESEELTDALTAERDHIDRTNS